MSNNNPVGIVIHINEELQQEQIDKLNILVASRKAMETAVKRLPLTPGFLLIDGIVPLETDIPEMHQEGRPEKPVGCRGLHPG